MDKVPVEPTAPARMGDEIKRALGRLIWRAFDNTPKILRPALGVLLVAVQATVTGILVVLLLTLISKKSYELDIELLAGLTICGLIAAVAFGTAREYVPLSKGLRPWVLACVAASTFWLAVILEVFLERGRMPANLAEVGVFVLMIGVFTLVGGLLLRR